MMRPISEIVQHQTYNGSDDDGHGNQTESWGAAVDLGIYAYNPASSSEVVVDGHAHRVESKPTILVPSTASVGSRDKIIARGVTFEVDGYPADFRNPFNGGMDGLEINLKVVAG